MADHNPLQIIDFGPFLSGEDKLKVPSSMLESFKSTGFVYLINHGVSQEKIATMFDWSKRFFSQPLEIKQLAPHPTSGAHHRGYSAPGMERIIRPHLNDDESQLTDALSDVPDVKESFDLGREDDDMMPNIWLPDGILPGFKEACLDFFRECYQLERAILRSLAIGFGLAEDYFLPFHTKPDNQMRLVRYPSVSFADLRNGKVSRIDSHSDFGSLTILFQDNVGGLEVEDLTAPGHFKPVKPIPKTVIVNAGDFLMRWSNDIIKSTVHRVRAPLNNNAGGEMVPDRYSIPYVCKWILDTAEYLDANYFSCADFSTTVDCIPGTWSEEYPKKYKPISAQEYIMKRLAATY